MNDQDAGKKITLYIYTRYGKPIIGPKFLKFENIYIAPEDLRLARLKEVDSLVIKFKNSPYEENRKVCEVLRKNLLWVSPKEKDIIESDYIVFWMEQPNDFEACSILIQYISSIMSTTMATYSITITNFSKDLNELVSIENLLIENQKVG